MVILCVVTSDGSWSCSNTVEINPDTNSLSDRPEWCSVIYDSVFIPHVAYRIEFQWLVSTVSLVAKFVSQWIRKAELCAFRLVPVPTLEILEVQAFSKQHRISLPLDFERMKSKNIRSIHVRISHVLFILYLITMPTSY